MRGSSSDTPSVCDTHRNMQLGHIPAQTYGCIQAQRERENEKTLSSSSQVTNNGYTSVHVLNGGRKVCVHVCEVETEHYTERMLHDSQESVCTECVCVGKWMLSHATVCFYVCLYDKRNTTTTKRETKEERNVER